MALITCEECGREISDKAGSCPHCGYPVFQAEQQNDKSIRSEEIKPISTMSVPKEAEQAQSGLGIASLILGIIGVLLSFFWIGWIPGIVGLILGIVGAFKKNAKHGCAIAGTVLSTISILITILLLLGLAFIYKSI